MDSARRLYSLLAKHYGGEKSTAKLALLEPMYQAPFFFVGFMVDSSKVEQLSMLALFLDL